MDRRTGKRPEEKTGKNAPRSHRWRPVQFRRLAAELAELARDAVGVAKMLEQSDVDCCRVTNVEMAKRAIKTLQRFVFAAESEARPSTIRSIERRLSGEVESPDDPDLDGI